MRRLNQIAAVFFIVLAIVLGRHAAGLQYYTRIGPGAGFFPLWICILMGVLAAIHFVSVTLAPAEPLPADFFGTKQDYWRMGGGLIAILVLAPLIPLIGFRLTMFGFFAAVLVLFGRRGPVEVLALALAGSFGVYHVMTSYLSMPLPIGMFGI